MDVREKRGNRRTYQVAVPRRHELHGSLVCELNGAVLIDGHDGGWACFHQGRSFSCVSRPILRLRTNSATNSPD